MKGYHLELKCHPLLFHSYINGMKAAVAHHPVWSRVDELLAKDAVEPSIGGDSFYSNVCNV